MGKKHSLTTDQKKRKKIITYYHLVKKNHIFQKNILISSWFTKKKHSPYYIKRRRKKETDKFKKKSLFLFKFFSPQKKLITLFSSPNFPLYSQQKKNIYSFFFIYIFSFLFLQNKKYNICYKKIPRIKKFIIVRVEIVKCSIVQLKILMFKSCKILCFLVVDLVVFFIPPQKL